MRGCNEEEGVAPAKEPWSLMLYKTFRAARLPTRLQPLRLATHK